MNGNGKRDQNETKVGGLKIRMNGGRVENNLKDTTLRVYDLKPYASYLIEMDPNSLDNISWRLAKKSMKVSINPNQLKLIEMPVSILGEVSGAVYLNEKESSKGLGRVMVFIYNAKGNLVARTLSESDGYFSYLGLPSGDYTAAIDSAQLNKLGFVSSPSTINFQIINTGEGDIAGSRDFTLKDTKPVLVDVEVKTYFKFEEEAQLKKFSGKLIERQEQKSSFMANPLQKRNYVPINPMGIRNKQLINPKTESLKIYPLNRPNVTFKTELFDNSASYFNPRVALINSVWVYVIYSYRAYR